MPKRKKHLLVIAYIWPPYAGAGVQRVLKFVKYLTRLDWQITVITPRISGIPVKDSALSNEVPKSVKVIRTGTWEYRVNPILRSIWMKKRDSWGFSALETSEQKGITKLKSTVIRAVRMAHTPDETIGWIPHAINAASRVAKKHKPDVIFASAPPYSVLLAATILGKKLSIPVVSDFRDAWSNFPEGHQRFPMPQWRKRLERAMEKWVLTNSRFVTAASESTLAYLVSRGLESSRALAIKNGYDPEDFKGLKKKKSVKFTFVYSGSFYGKISPLNFFKGLKIFLDLYPNEIGKIEVVFYGEKTLSLGELARDVGLQVEVAQLGYRPHHQAIQALVSADCSLLIVAPGKGSEEVYPGKIFEYLYAKTPILALVPTNSPVAKLVKEAKAGEVVKENDLKKISDAIAKIYFNKHYEVSDDNKIRAYSRKSQAATLNKLLLEAVIKDG